MGQVAGIDSVGAATFGEDIILIDGRIDTPGDTLVRIYDSNDDGVIDIYQNNSVVLSLSGATGNIQGGTSFDIGTSGDTDLLQLAANSLTLNGDLTLSEYLRKIVFS